MTSRAAMETEAERRILLVIEEHYPPMRAQLDTLQPLEAYALLGNLVLDTIARFPPSQRVRLTKAWAVTLIEGVQDGIARLDARDRIDAAAKAGKR
jgi:hypothetical protein